MTKSREAYETQQVAFLHRPSARSSRRARPQSAGGGWNGREHTGSNGCVKEDGIATPAPGRSSVPGVGGIGRGGKASFDHPGGPPSVPPPPFSRRVDGGVGSATTTNASGAPIRLGKHRTRVRPSSANARVYGRPGAGHGVGGGGGGYASSSAGISRRVHLPPQGEYGEGSKIAMKGDRGQVTMVG